MGSRRGISADLDALSAATADVDPPMAVLDLDALDANAADLVRRAAGTPVRVASKSVRCRAVLERALSTPGFAGVMAYSLREAIWLVRSGVTDDVLMGYPTVDRTALAELGADAALVGAITLMVDSAEQLDLVRSVARDAEIRVCVDVDASLRIGRLHLGVRRSPVRTPDDASALARAARERHFAVVGVMFYEAQIAGLPDSSPAVRAMKRRSAAELRTRRRAVVDAVQNAMGKLAIVNGGGTGSLEITSADDVITEASAGSGLYCPALFDGYQAFEPRPALFFALPVVRRPSPRIATLFGGGYIASGPAGKSRHPALVDRDLELLGAEGAGEVQTPVRGNAAERLRPGDRVWMRHAKAGELCERFDELHVVENGRRIGSWATYRGDGQNFG